jgi:ribonucleotide monophosphatase NagD (HAD superfamily)
MLRKGIKRVLVLGTQGVGHALRQSGIETTYTGEPQAAAVEAVYVGWHPECGMKDIETACHAILGGAKLYVASDVPFFATKHGRTFGYSCAIVGAIRRVTRSPAILTGKPSQHALRYVAKQLGVAVTSVCVVGDDPIVEIVMARRGGAAALGVTTGMMRLADWQRQPATHRPHRVLKDLRELLTLTG